MISDGQTKAKTNGQAEVPAQKGSLANPTAFFFQQASAVSGEHTAKINEFVSKLLDVQKCVLCGCDYNFSSRIPRILVHCGHTFCSSCLRNFYRNMRVRCPLCLKLIKNLESIERLPVNHTIFGRMAEEMNNNAALERDLQARRRPQKNNFVGKKDFHFHIP
eukprot:TRINITY_DN1616_c0_g2_i2.p1 TRINITY_DN1616_c0_g2~~TRINITY_DN1616_c0_g2_i2.p1  ORF type:complete len:162 (+),score=39.50 TRINITY_DN1616_c0_g2_i2:83-568(+)